MNIGDIKNVEAVSAELKIQCANGCGKVVVIQSRDFIRVAVDGLPGVYESGIGCPSCGTFYIAAWDSDVLIKLRAEVKQARGQYRQLLQRAYMRDFKKLQRDMQERERQLREARERGLAPEEAKSRSE